MLLALAKEISNMYSCYICKAANAENHNYGQMLRIAIKNTLITEESISIFLRIHFGMGHRETIRAGEWKEVKKC